MTGHELILGAVGGVAVGVVITALRWAISERFADPPPMPASPEVLEAERRDRNQNPLTDRRTR